MKNTVAKTFKTIFIVLAVVLLIITALLYFIDTPVVEEGQEPTAAQKLILLGKQHLAEILAVCGVSGISLIGVFAKLIYNSAKSSLAESRTMSAVVLQLTAKSDQQEKIIARQNEAINIMSKKQDIANNLLMTIFSLSELPATLREQIHSAQTEYNGLDKTTNIVEQVVDVVKNVADSENQHVDVDISISPVGEVDVAPGPVYM